EPRGVEQMRAQVGQDAGALVSPDRVTHESRSSVAIKHATLVNAAQLSRLEQAFHTDEVRLEAMVVGGIADDALGPRKVLKPLDLPVLGSPERFLYQHMLAVGQQI